MGTFKMFSAVVWAASVGLFVGLCDDGLFRLVGTNAVVDLEPGSETFYPDRVVRHLRSRDQHFTVTGSHVSATRLATLAKDLPIDSAVGSPLYGLTLAGLLSHPVFGKSVTISADDVIEAYSIVAVANS